ncbi:helix-turn-helix domain-containing protein [Paenibacillus sp. NFR01]|uniref:GH39 family glycosyl hydrolase n=1 Tax=Paenibacillus sp. NFR01 TaxID=1566279 RepID=UPI0008ABC6FB|nr:helix-turn-helix domain-containing protein [Paenibacillus sp. NFR01]SET04492.1 xylan 1,4-beta-xylosidase [Paenibacillus sp. NFR01]
MKLFVNSVKHVDFHWHKEVEILYVLHGSINMYLDQKQYSLNEDDIIVINSMSVHKIERTHQDNVLLTLQFGPELLNNSIFISCNSALNREQDTSRLYSIKQDLARMVWEINKKSPGYQRYTMGRLQMLCGCLLRYFSDGTNPAVNEGSKDNDYKRLNSVLTYIDKHYNEKITLQDMADAEHLSLHYFSHFFTDKIGIPFQKYLTLIRLEKAQIELAANDKTISDIALDCGFANVKLFNKYFKEKYGCTPGSFREASLAPEPHRLNFNRKPVTYAESSSGDYYEMDTLNAIGSLYRYLEVKTDIERVPSPLPDALATEPIRIEVGADSTTRPYEKHWNLTTTAGRAVEGLREDWRKQLSAVKKNIPFRHIRFHGIFNDEMMVYSENEDGTPVYNWSYVDKLYDFLLEQGIRPFVELSFMPGMLARSEETLFWWRGNISPPAEPAKWEALVREFIRHCLNRYGASELKQWYFEVWNEPDLAGVCWAGSKEEYFSFYESTVRAIKSVLPELKTGGPAMGYGSLWNDTWTEAFLAYCRERDVPLDFFSFHIYSEYPKLKSEEGHLTKIMPPSFYKESIDLLRQKMIAASYSQVELHITEWNFSLYDRNLLHDTMFMAPFVIYQTMNTLSDVKAMAFWSFTDVFEESTVPASPFYGGFGLINRDGLKKPAYYAFELMQKLGEEMLIQGDGVIGTRNNDGSMQFLFYHYVHVDQLFASGDWTELSFSSRYEVFEETGSKAFDFTLHLLPGPYKCTSYQLDREHGSVFDEWIRMGSPEFLTEEEILYLNGRSGPVIQTEMVRTNRWHKEILLPPHGVMLLQFERQY